MNTGSVAKLLNASSRTVHRWTQAYHPFLELDATPQDGLARVFHDRDVQVLLFVSQLRQRGIAHSNIRERLEAMKETEWNALPDLPATAATESRNVILPSDYVKRITDDTGQLHRVVENLQERIAALESEWASLQELTSDLAMMEDLLRARESDLADTQRLIEQQRETLQIAEVAFTMNAERRASHAEAMRRRRRIFWVALVVLVLVSFTVYMIIFY